MLFGAPLDLTESFRTGTATAPDRIRTASDVLETYSPVLRLDLDDHPLVDWGDLDFTDASMSEALEAVGTTVALARTVALPIMLGGEHTASYGAVQTLATLYPSLTIVHVDAHTDLRDRYSDTPFSHATVMRRIGDLVGLGRIAQYGIRSGTRDEFELSRQCLYSGPDIVMSRAVRDRIHTRPVYLTIDIDVLDPASAPGTGCPEPGGCSFADLLAFLYSLRGLNVIGVDVMEVCPAVDVNDITSVAAAKLVREAALLFGSRQAATLVERS